MALSAAEVAEYLRQYVLAYRQEYARLTAPPPSGGGYPPVEISPYLYARDLLCLLSPDGTAILDESREPPGQWWIAGGPALMADVSETRTPTEVVELLKREGLWGQPIGIYRLVASDELPDPIWLGQLPQAIEETRSVAEGTSILVRSLPTTHLAVIQRLTFGTLGLIIDLHLRGPDSAFWFPHIIRQMGFLTADRQHHRFVNYLELSPHTEPAAWDTRGIPVRVQADVRRDFGWAFSLPERQGATISFGERESWIQPYRDRLSRLGEAIDAFAVLLEREGNAPESVFQDFLTANPILLDVYGDAIPKPRFDYPEGASPLGKAYVEPDFIIRYPGNRYQLVELERPSKRAATREGQPRAELTQATFQIAEWRAYIANHADRIRATFPGIALSHTAMVVLGRSTAESFGVAREPRAYRELLAAQYPEIEFFTYDDLLERARQAYVRLSSLGIPMRSPVAPGA